MKLSVSLWQPTVRKTWKYLRTPCALSICRNTLLRRRLTSRHPGIRVGKRWFCGVDCFAIAAQVQISELLSTAILEMPHNPRLSIGLVLLSKGHLSDDQLRLGLAQSKLHGENIEVSLMKLGFATERQIASARAMQWGYPVLGYDRIAEPASIRIPSMLLRACFAMPVHYSPTTERVLMGFVYKVDHSLLHSIEMVTGCKTEPCFITPTEYEEQIGRLGTGSDPEEIVYEDQLTPMQMAEIVGGYALDVRASDAGIASCRDFVWARLSGRRRKIDILFRVRATAELGKRMTSLDAEKRIYSLGYSIEGQLPIDSQAVQSAQSSGISKSWFLGRDLSTRSDASSYSAGG